MSFITKLSLTPGTLCLVLIYLQPTFFVEIKPLFSVKWWRIRDFHVLCWISSHFHVFLLTFSVTDLNGWSSCWHLRNKSFSSTVSKKIFFEIGKCAAVVAIFRRDLFWFWQFQNIPVAPSLDRKMATVIPEFENGVFVSKSTSSALLSSKHHIFWISVKKRFFWRIAYQAPRTSNMFSISKKNSSELALFTSLWQSFFVNSLKLLSFNKFQVQGVNQLIFFYLLEPLWIQSVRTSFWLDLPIVSWK